MIDLVAVKGKKEPVKMFQVLRNYNNATELEKDIFRSYEKALNLYFNQEFNQAKILLEEILKKNVNDGPSNALYNRVVEFIKNPPGEDWNGVWIMKTK